jgi:hypothetical protein
LRSGLRGIGLRIDLTRGAFDGLGLTLLARLALTRALRIRNLRQPGIEPRNRVIELSCDALLARGVAARYRLGNLVDLAGDGIEPLMDVGDIVARRGRARLAIAEIRWGGLANGRVEPVVQRHAGAARGGFGPLADGWIDAVNTPRYARIHDTVRF